MADRLIYANALKQALSVLFEESSFCYVEDIINAQPTVDAVEVVRCKDCAYYVEIARPCPVCAVLDRDVLEDDYCSCGERREDGKE